MARIGYAASLAADTILARANTINATDQCPPNLEALIKSRLNSGRYDYVWFNYLRVVPRNLKTDANIICDLHDFQTERIRADVLPTISPWRRGYYLRRYERSEFAALNSCDTAIAISPIEAQRFAEDQKVLTSIVCLPATDDARPLPYSTDDAKFDLVYIGSRSDANVAGIIWFLEKCFPLIVDDVPMVRLLIQGTIVNTTYLKKGVGSLRNGANITLSGPVPSLDSVYASGKVIICPVLHGTGMKIKMVEAMAYGKAIVATSKAGEGIAKDLGLEAHDGALDFAAACVRLLRNQDEADRLCGVSRDTFARDHDRSAIVRKLASIFTS